MGIFFEGEFSKGYKNGQGWLETETKIYEGIFKQDMKQGTFRIIDKYELTVTFQEYRNDEGLEDITKYSLFD